ncbi:hypothetical protein [Pedobacter heparinus]|uniref:hypothetical protein n=1 Tax=Pedobacter heparinus TaxID=984 RepID=UPI00292CF028|nr:hypothetical protein [Pedobacter heparinus]
MRTHTKTTLQKLVFELMAPGQEPLGDEEILKWVNQLPKITKEVIQVMRLILFGTLSRKLVCRHLGQIRMECTLMLDALYHYPEFPNSMMVLYQSTLNCLERLLDYQQSHYRKYLDQRDRMPILLYAKAARRVAAQVDEMLRRLNKGGVDRTLQAIVAGKMTRLISQETGSYQQICCLQLVQQWVFQLSKAELKAGISSRLIALLVKAKFNTDGFASYCKEQLKAKTADADLSGQASVESYRIEVAFSVDALAYFFKLLIAAGVVMADPKSQLFQFIARSFKTPGIGQGSVSAHSFTNKYNQVVQATAKTVRAMLVRMLKLLDKEFDLA